MGTHYKHLTLTDRYQIEAWLKVKTDIRVIADNLGVSPCTIYREKKRGEYEHLNTDYTTEMRYSADRADRKYRENLKAKGGELKIGSDIEFATYIEKKIVKNKYSPEAVLGEIKVKGKQFKTTISKTTLYRYIDNGVFLTLSNKHLPSKNNRKGNKINKKPKSAPKGTSIEQRPNEITERSTFGNWEMDCVEGKKKTKGALLVLTERLTRDEIIKLMKDKTAASVISALDEIEQDLGSEKFSKIFRTITVDNGSEFSNCEGIEQSISGGKRTKVYYCHPYSAYERGSNENCNKLIRRHFPKGTSFEKISKTTIKKLEKWINNYPRKILGYHNSGELFDEQLNLLSAADIS